MMIAVVSPAADSVANPNVMLEIGYLRALERPVLLLTGNPDELPFDLRTHRALTYVAGSERDPAFQERLTELLRSLLRRLEIK
jgi:hypothetical protein